MNAEIQKAMKVLGLTEQEAREMLEADRKIDKGEEALIVDVSEDLLGEEGLDALMKHLDPNGDPSVTDMVDALTELMTSVNELKN